MTSRVLQWLGIAAIAALVGGSIAALMIVRERIQVTVAEAQDARRRSGSDRAPARGRSAL
jgi:hypothetical protein